MVKKIDGISRNATEVRTLLLGQVGKNYAFDNQINLAIILENVYSVFKSVQHLIGGRIILLECKDENRLISYYKKHGFYFLQKEKNQTQMIKVFNTK
ncbi:MAG TPA: hypothetical protein QF753_19245 [Victivallales bacterium]|nr:hypothetical protein [Victivallales bacterium]|tara:strand:+ start:989 stop:1279 length:291 start_codon:yes stop_codon:yes gene_type:complete